MLRVVSVPLWTISSCFSSGCSYRFPICVRNFLSTHSRSLPTLLRLITTGGSMVPGRLKDAFDRNRISPKRSGDSERYMPRIFIQETSPTSYINVDVSFLSTSDTSTKVHRHLLSFTSGLPTLALLPPLAPPFSLPTFPSGPAVLIPCRGRSVGP